MCGGSVYLLYDDVKEPSDMFSKVNIYSLATGKNARHSALVRGTHVIVYIQL